MLRIKQETEAAIESKVNHFTLSLDVETQAFSRQLLQNQKRQNKLLNGYYSESLQKFLADAEV